jgi:hypothetical protein
MPAGYGVKFPDISALPTAIATSIQQFRKTVAGEFVFRLYQERDAI